jgi:hypothetical protein
MNIETNPRVRSNLGVSEKAMILYRYLPEHAALATIESGTVRLGRFTNFNDPFEILPVKTALVGGPGIVSNSNSDWFREALDKNKGILSFSHADTIENPLLWSHYADHHRGIALGFEVVRGDKGEFGLELNLPEREPRGIAVKPVEYGTAADNSRVRIPEIDHLETVADIDKVIENYTPPLSFRKGMDWAYEQEWRAVVPLLYADAKGGMNLLTFQKTRLRKIVLGCRCPVTPDYISRLLKDPTGNTAIERAVPHEHEFRLKIDTDP